MKRKIIILLMLIIILVPIPTAFAHEGDTYSSATEYDYPPFSVTSSGEADGFSVELLRAVMNVMDLNVTFKIINGQVDLKTLITSQPHNASLGAIIRSRLLIIHGTGTDKVLTEQLVEIEGYRKIWSEYIDVYLRTEKPIYYSSGHVFSVNYGDPIISFLFKRYSSNGIQHEYFLDQNMYFDSTDSAIRYGFSKISSRASLVYLSATIYPVVKSLKLNAKINGEEKMILYLNFPFTYLKSGSLSFMGTCINNTSYKSKTSVFGGIQDITSSISATPN